MVKIEEDIKLDFNDVLIKPKRSTLASRSEVVLNRTYKMKHISFLSWNGVPIVVSNMDSTGTFETAMICVKHKMLTCIHKHYTEDDWLNWVNSLENNLVEDDWQYIAISTGISDSDFENTCKIMGQIKHLNIICIDVANGYAENFVNNVIKFRTQFPDKIIIAGNVVSSEMTEQLILSGADIVKIGIGPGSVCTTRKQTGVGYPQLSCILECADAAHGLGGLVMSDGGCVCPGDFAKAFGAGADFVMAGGVFAGHDESSGEIIDEDGKKYKMFYGMSSKTAMVKYKGSVANYRSSEGKTVKIPYKGSLIDTIQDILGGIRSTCTYVGAKTLKELPKRTTFIRVNRQLNNVFN